MFKSLTPLRVGSRLSETFFFSDLLLFFDLIDYMEDLSDFLDFGFIFYDFNDFCDF